MQEILEYAAENPWQTGTALFLGTNALGLGLYLLGRKYESATNQEQVKTLNSYAEGYEDARRGDIKTQKFPLNKGNEEEIESLLENSETLSSTDRAYLEGVQDFLN